MSEQQTDLEPIEKAIKQLLAVKPQLLFEASKNVYAEYFLETVKADLENKPKLKQSLIIRGAILQAIANVLINSGKASLSDYDIASMIHVAQMRAEVDKRNGNGG